jgi:protein TonB
VLTTLTAAPAQASDGREWGARGLSLVVHTGLIALAVWYTQAAGAPHGGRPDPGVILTWTTRPVPAHGPPPPTAPAAPGAPAAVPMPVPGPVLPPIDVPPGVAWPATAADPFPGLPGTALPTDPVGPPPMPSAPPMDVRTVEEPPILLSYPAPGYPELLRRAGVEGQVTVEAVLDTTGRAERASLRIVSSTHALFVPPATVLVLGSRYRPARFGGKAVRVRVQIPVTFALRR